MTTAPPETKTWSLKAGNDQKKKKVFVVIGPERTNKTLVATKLCEEFAVTRVYVLGASSTDRAHYIDSKKKRLVFFAVDYSELLAWLEDGHDNKPSPHIAVVLESLAFLPPVHKLASFANVVASITQKGTAAALVCVSSEPLETRPHHVWKYFFSHTLFRAADAIFTQRPREHLDPIPVSCDAVTSSSAGWFVWERATETLFSYDADIRVIPPKRTLQTIVNEATPMTQRKQQICLQQAQLKDESEELEAKLQSLLIELDAHPDSRGRQAAVYLLTH